MNEQDIMIGGQSYESYLYRMKTAMMYVPWMM